MKNRRFRVVMAAMLVLAATLVLPACDLEDSFGFNVPSAGNIEVIPTSVSLSCWYPDPVSGPAAPMRVVFSINRVSRRVTVSVLGITQVSPGVADGRLRVRCATQSLLDGGRYRLPGPGELADDGFVVVGIYFNGAASYHVSVNEHRRDSVGQIDIIPWLDGPYGRAVRNLPAPRM